MKQLCKYKVKQTMKTCDLINGLINKEGTIKVQGTTESMPDNSPIGEFVELTLKARIFSSEWQQRHKGIHDVSYELIISEISARETDQ